MSPWPDVVNYLLAALPTLPGWDQVEVYDGPPNVAVKPPLFCTVGFVTDDIAGSFGQVRDGSVPDYSVGESGSVRLEIAAQTGDEDLSVIRPQLFGLFAALDLHIRADQSLGGLVMGPTLLSGDGVQTLADASGRAMTLTCSLTYQTISF